MTTETKRPQVNYFVPKQGNYYHFISETILGLYNMLKEELILDSLDCKLWYQGNYVEIVQMFSRHPIEILPVENPHIRDATAIGPNIKTSKQVPINTKVGFCNLIPIVGFLSDRIPLADMQKAITIIKRVKCRAYLETEELADKLRPFGFPVRVVQMENETFASQVNIMRNTKILIAPHGAGTMNQIFMPKGGKIIELFPKGISNWHAKAVAEVFGHNFIEIESNKPGPFGREPDELNRRWIEKNGWPDRKEAEVLRKRSAELVRVIRDVKHFSINPELILKVVEETLS